MCETVAASCHRPGISDHAWQILASQQPGGPARPRQSGPSGAGGNGDRHGGQ